MQDARGDAKWTTRSHANAVDCPRCKAVAGQPCVTDAGVHKKSPHQDRHALALDQGAPVAVAKPTPPRAPARDAERPRRAAADQRPRRRR